VVAHAGTECKDLANPKNEDSCNKEEEIYKLLHELPPQTVDAVVAGHTHQWIAHFIAGTPVIESNANGTAFGRIELSFDPVSRRLRRDETKIFPPQSVCREVYAGTGRCDATAAKESSGKTEPATFYGANVEPDLKVTALLREARASVESVNQEVLGEVARPITRGEKGESAMGNFVTDLMRAYTKQDKAIKDADFAVQNGGGLRADLSAGELRYGALFEVLPFENVLVTVQLTGAQVRALFDAALRTGRVFHVSGLKIVYQSTPKAGVTPKERFDFDDYTHTLLRIETEKGKPLDEKKTYVMVWNDFLANGGDGTKGVIEGLPAGAVERHYNATLRDSAAALLRKNQEPLNAEKAPLLDPKKPRIVFEIKK
jgi:5'-nucleotidase